MIFMQGSRNGLINYSFPTVIKRKMGALAQRAVPLCFMFCFSAATMAATCDAPSGGKKWTDWLDAQEAAGGHAKACHLGITEQGLIRRLEGGGTNVTGVCLPGTAASAWSDKQKLIDAAQEALKASKKAIDDNGPGNHIYDGVSDGTIGTVVVEDDGGNKKLKCSTNGKYLCKSTMKWRVIFQKTALDCFMLTAYPTP